MTCLVVRSLSGTWMKLYSSMLGAFFVYTFYVTTMNRLGLFSRNLRGDFFMKIGTLFVKVDTKKVLNIEEYNFVHVPLRLLTTKQVIEVLYL